MSEPSPKPETPAPARPERPEVAAVHAIARELRPDRARGDVAALRRMKPGEIECPAFWKLAAVHLQDVLPAQGEARNKAERRWGAILAGLAEVVELHAPGRRLGHALAAADVAELRVLRLLRAHDDALLDMVRTIAHQLDSKAERVDWADVARLVLSDGRADEETVRRSIARDFYSNHAENP
jgi:CRISPR system Cascade subunit CasB